MSRPCPIQSQVSYLIKDWNIYFKIPYMYFQILLAKETIESLEKRVKVMENNVDNPDISDEKKKLIMTELVEIKKLLDRNTELLSKLHKENSKSFVVAVIIFFLCFLIYGVYVMFINE